jgi:aspartate kinase
MMPTIMKFGGTSLEDTEAFERVRRIVWAERAAHPIVVASALSRVTDALLRSVSLAADESMDEELALLQEHFERHLSIARNLLAVEAQAFFEEQLARAQREIAELLLALNAAADSTARAALQDAIASCGEQLSANLLATILREGGLPARYIDARRCILTTDEHGRAEPLMEETVRRTRLELEPLLAASEIPVLGGFIGSSASGATTTLGRGGSDYTAALIGASLAAREIQIWTDVSGVLTADPRLVKAARTIPRLTYAEAAELAYFGAKVLHPKTIQPAIEQRIPVRICNSHAPEDAGTLVSTETERLPHTVKAIAHKTGSPIIQIISARMLGAYGFLHAIFEIFNRHRTVIDVVTTSEVSVSLSLDDTTALPAIIEELKRLGDVQVERPSAIICVVGEGLRNTAGIATRVFSCLSDINVSLISQGASSINLTLAVAEEDLPEAINRLHAVFFESDSVATTDERKACAAREATR